MTAETAREDSSSNALYAESLEFIFSRNEFYKTAHHRVLVTTIVSLIFNVAMTTILLWLWMEKISPVYFPTDPNGRLLRELPLSEPIFSDAEVQRFAIKAAKAVTSFDYLNYRRDLQGARKYFTDKGFDNYIKALDESRNLTTVLDQRLVSRGELVGKVTLKNSQIGGRHVWFVNVPMNIRYENQALTIIQPLELHLLIGRVPTTVSLQAMQIAQMWIEDRGVKQQLQGEVKKNAS